MQIKKPSFIPVYGTAAVWVLYCLIFPLYKPSHFLFLIVAGVASYVVLSKLFPGETVTVDVPVSTGNADADELLETGKKAVSDMKQLRGQITNTAVAEKVDKIISITEKIFKQTAEDTSNVPQVKKFANYYLPTTVKLLSSYVKMSDQQVGGENISGTIEKIEEILDTTEKAYEKQLDSLFANQAMDIETDITVLEAMLKREGLTGKDF